MSRSASTRNAAPGLQPAPQRLEQVRGTARTCLQHPHEEQCARQQRCQRTMCNYYSLQMHLMYALCMLATSKPCAYASSQSSRSPPAPACIPCAPSLKTLGSCSCKYDFYAPMCHTPAIAGFLPPPPARVQLAAAPHSPPLAVPAACQPPPLPLHIAPQWHHHFPVPALVAAQEMSPHLSPSSRTSSRRSSKAT